MRLFVLAALFSLAAAPADARPYDEIMKNAQTAFTNEDYAAASTLLDEAQAQRPYSLYLTRNRVLVLALAGRNEEALALVREVADRGLTLELPQHEAIARLQAGPGFAPIAAQMAENEKPLGEARIVAEFAENGLLPEAIAKWGDGFLIGSVRTGGIYEARDGKLREIAKLDGGVFDIEAGANRFHAAINNQLAYEKAGERDAEAAIVDVAPGGDIFSRTRVADSKSLIGDFEVSGDVTLYASDSITPRILHTSNNGGAVEAFVDSRFVNPQGIALDERRRRLYVADYLAGLFIVDTRTGAVEQIANPSNAHLGGIDGLYLYKGDLIGVQNGTTPQRIVRIDLDRSGKVAKKLTVLQRALPEWNEPTHGTVDGDEFIYIATSNWPAYDDAGNVRDGATLAPLRLMSVPLD